MFSVEGKGSDDMDRAYFSNVPFNRSKVCQLCLIALEGRVGFEKLVACCILVILPKPIILFERVEILSHCLSDTLDTSSQEQGHLHELNVLRDASKECMSSSISLR